MDYKDLLTKTKLKITNNRTTFGLIVTIFLFVCAILLSYQAWELYMRAPWTRDAFVRAEVTVVASENISDNVIKIHVENNQRVKKGDLLLEINPKRYEESYKAAKHTYDETISKYKLQSSLSKMRNGAGDAVSLEDKQIYDTNSKVAKEAMENALAQLNLAKINLDRTKIYAPVDGIINNMYLRVGDFAENGKRLMSIINDKSFWVEAYFEEIKISKVKVGQPAVIKLMAYPEPINGKVKSISKGILNTNNQSGFQGLQNVQPIDAWIRLAQRIPVWIEIENVPEGMELAAGMTASVDVGNMSNEIKKPDSIGAWIIRWLEFNL